MNGECNGCSIVNITKIAVILESNYGMENVMIVHETTFSVNRQGYSKSDRRLGSLVLPKRLGNVKVVVNRNYGMENVMVVQ